MQFTASPSARAASGRSGEASEVYVVCHASRVEGLSGASLPYVGTYHKATMCGEFVRNVCVNLNLDPDTRNGVTRNVAIYIRRGDGGSGRSDDKGSDVGGLSTGTGGRIAGWDGALPWPYEPTRSLAAAGLTSGDELLFEELLPAHTPRAAHATHAHAGPALLHPGPALAPVPESAAKAEADDVMAAASARLATGISAIGGGGGTKKRCAEAVARFAEDEDAAIAGALDCTAFFDGDSDNGHGDSEVLAEAVVRQMQGHGI